MIHIIYQYNHEQRWETKSQKILNFLLYSVILMYVSPLYLNCTQSVSIWLRFEGMCHCKVAFDGLYWNHLMFSAIFSLTCCRINCGFIQVQVVTNVEHPKTHLAAFHYGCANHFHFQIWMPNLRWKSLAILITRGELLLFPNCPWSDTSDWGKPLSLFLFYSFIKLSHHAIISDFLSFVSLAFMSERSWD